MRVAIADDDVLTRQGVFRMLEQTQIEVVAEAGDADQLVGCVAKHHPDAVIVDIRMPPSYTTEGLDAAITIRHNHPDVSVLVLSQHVEPAYALMLLEEHPERSGYLLKERIFDPVNLLDALTRLADGETVVDPTIVSRLLGRRRRIDPLEELTDRERDVLGLLAEGLSNHGIAKRLFLAERTVEAHITQIFQKLALDSDPHSHRRVLAVLAYLRST